MRVTVGVAAADGNQTRSAAAGEPGPIDRVHLSRYTLGNRELENEVLQLFAEHAPKYLEDLRTAPTDKSWRDAAHTLKGSAFAVGAIRVAEAAERAETLDVTDPCTGREPVVAAVAEAIDEARRHIATLNAGA